MGARSDELRHGDRVDDLADAVGETGAAPTAETAALREEIEQTRAEMSGTIDAIQQKLNPEVLAEQAKEAAREAAGHAVEQAKEAVREATVGKAEDVVRNVTNTAQDFMHGAGDTASDARATIFETIRRNPVPAALTGFGLAWLFMNRERPAARPSTMRYYQTERRYSGGLGTTQVRAADGSPAWNAGWDDYPGRRVQQGRYMPDQVQEQGSGVMDRAAEAAGNLASQAQETAGEIASQAQDTVSYAADRAQAAARTAGSTAGGAGSALLDTIKQNPIPAALAGVSLAWLAMNRPSSPSRSPLYGSYDRGYSQGSGGAGQQVGDMVNQAQATAGQMVDQVQSTAGRVANQTQETFGEVADQAQQRALQARHGFEGMLQENPLMIGAAAFVLGALVGMPVPATPQEQQLLGEARDTLVERAQEMAQETFDKVQQVAEGVRDTVQEEARGQGLMQ